ncbi:MAG: hypothetical protein SFU91_06300 [Chloroherpetonaceae bacterium]|nr:hypothetical protein [Chloroherpetonaceae bacterium]
MTSSGFVGSDAVVSTSSTTLFCSVQDSGQAGMTCLYLVRAESLRFLATLEMTYSIDGIATRWFRQAQPPQFGACRIPQRA